MNDALKMQISAFVDGELPDAEADLLTRRLSRDTDLRRQAARYLEIGQLMRGEAEMPAVGKLRARIAAALDGEAALAGLPPDRPAAGSPRWLRPAAGVAIAASVAVLALVGLRQLDVPQAGTAVPTAALAFDDGRTYTEPDLQDVMSDRPADMLLQYYLSHGQTAGELGANGILSEFVTLEQLVEVAPAGGEALEPDAAAEDNGTSERAQE